MDLVVEGRAFVKGKLVQCCVGIEGGIIRSIRKVLRGDEHADYGDKLLLPGAVDPHVHFRDPGLTRKEDFSTGTASAAFGGVTCVLDMPNTRPPVLTVDSVEDKARTAARKAWVDFGLIGGASVGSDPGRIAGRVVAFKLYMSSVTGRLLVSAERDVERTVASVAGTGRLLCVHAEDESKIGQAREEGLSGHDRRRPAEAEASALEILSRAGAERGVHICHVSSMKGLDAIGAQSWTKEACPHHLLLHKGLRLGTYGKVNPPLRAKEESEALFEAFRSGRIDVLASDHAPHTIEEKELEFDEAPSGMPGVETSLPVMLALVKKGALDLGVLVRAACERPAQIFGINKGRIEVGMDADIVVVDPKEMGKVSARALHSRCGWTAFEGWEALFPQATYVRGIRIVEDGGLVGEVVGRDVVAWKRRTSG